MSKEDRDIHSPDEPAASTPQPGDLTDAEAINPPAESSPAELPIDMPPNEEAARMADMIHQSHLRTVVINMEHPAFAGFVH